MFAYCCDCNYYSEDKENIEDLKNEIEKDGGTLTITNDGYLSICPECHIEDSLIVD